MTKILENDLSYYNNEKLHYFIRSLLKESSHSRILPTSILTEILSKTKDPLVLKDVSIKDISVFISQ